MSYTCAAHGWQHLLNPCPSCQRTTVSGSTTQPFWTCPYCNIVYNHPWGCSNKACAVNNGELDGETTAEEGDK
jgi:ribosomal protein L37AE/L43A